MMLVDIISTFKAILVLFILIRCSFFCNRNWRLKNKVQGMALHSRNFNRIRKSVCFGSPEIICMILLLRIEKCVENSLCNTGQISFYNTCTKENKSFVAIFLFVNEFCISKSPQQKIFCVSLSPCFILFH